MTLLRLFILAAAMAFGGCEPQPTQPLATKPQSDQELTLTFGGFVVGGPEDERVQGVCSLTEGRTVLECDIYNGLTKWTLTELTTVVTWSPYGPDDKRYYRTSVSAEPLTTSHITIRLGVVLPRDEYLGTGRNAQPLTHWGWQTVGARGRPSK